MPEIPEMLSEPLIAEITSSHAPINPKLFIGHQGHGHAYPRAKQSTHNFTQFHDSIANAREYLLAVCIRHIFFAPRPWPVGLFLLY